MSLLKHTPLHDLHSSLDARFGPFAGYDMPLFYKAGIMTEHRHVREQAGLFDISHMLQVELSGPRSADLVSRLCPYDAAGHPAGRARYTFFLNENAGVMDDLIVTRLAQDRFLIVCNAGCAQKDLAHLQHHAPAFDVTITVRDRALIALQGPAAASILRSLGIDTDDLWFLDAREMTLEGGDWFISRSGYTGEDGFEIAMPGDAAQAFARRLLADPSVLPIGLGARDSLRMEAGLPLYGQDLGDDITPMEAGLTWAIPASHRGGGDFIGGLAVAQKIAIGRARKRIALRPQGSAPVRTHAAIFAGDGRQVGEVTSGGFGPTLGGPIALGLVEAAAQGPFTCDLRGRRIDTVTASLPFVPHRYRLPPKG